MIKPFNLQDFFLIANLQKLGTALNIEERLLYPYSPTSSALPASLFPAILGVSTYVLNSTDEHGPHRGFLQTRNRPGRPEQEVVFISPSLARGNGASALWQRLLTHACIKAGEYGVQRIYARVDGDGDEQQIFKHIGFTPYAQEELFKLEAETLSRLTASPLLKLRKQTVADSWSVQRLYAAVTPQAVQVAEGLAQGQWQVDKWSVGDPGRRHGYVWESQGEILAVLNFHSGRIGHWLRIMLHPDISAEAESIIETGLTFLKYPYRSVYCSLRTYQTEFNSALQACGFTCFTSQMMMVKHTTIRAKDFLTRLLPTLDVPAEAKPAATMLPAETQPSKIP